MNWKTHFLSVGLLKSSYNQQISYCENFRNENFRNKHVALQYLAISTVARS